MRESPALRDLEDSALHPDGRVFCESVWRPPTPEAERFAFRPQLRCSPSPVLSPHLLPPSAAMGDQTCLL